MVHDASNQFYQYGLLISKNEKCTEYPDNNSHNRKYSNK